MKKILYAFMILVLAVSCKIDEIKTFGEERFIFFGTVEEKYEYAYSFLYSAGKDEVVVKIPLKYAGRQYAEDQTYSIKVDPEKTTAKEGEEFRLPENPVFKASSYEDSLEVILKKSPRMDAEKLKISLQLVSNDNFTAAMKNALSMDIQVTNVIDKPIWWNAEVENAYLGDYSDKKFELFVKHIYSGDYGKLDANSKRFYALKYKKWLSENPDQAMDNGSLITVPVIG